MENARRSANATATIVTTHDRPLVSGTRGAWRGNSQSGRQLGVLRLRFASIAFKRPCSFFVHIYEYIYTFFLLRSLSSAPRRAASFLLFAYFSRLAPSISQPLSLRRPLRSPAKSKYTSITCLQDALLTRTQTLHFPSATHRRSCQLPIRYN